MVDQLALQPGERDAFVEETLDLSTTFGGALAALDAGERATIVERITAELRAFESGDRTVTLPGSALVAGAGA